MSKKAKGKKRKAFENTTVESFGLTGCGSEQEECSDEDANALVKCRPRPKKWRGNQQFSRSKRSKQLPCTSESGSAAQVDAKNSLEMSEQSLQEGRTNCFTQSSAADLVGISGVNACREPRSPSASSGCGRIDHVDMEDDGPGPSHAQKYDGLVEVIDVSSDTDTGRSSPEVVVVGSRSPDQSITQQIRQDEEMARRLQARFAQENDIDLEASSSDAVIMTNELDPSLLPNSHWEIEGRLDQNEADGDHLYDTSWHRNHIAHRLRSRPTGSPLNVRFAVGLEILAPLALLRSRSIEGGRQSRSYEELLRLIDRLGPSNQSGLTKKEIDRLPCKKLMKADDLSNTDQRNCVICLTDFKKGQNLRVLPCSHRFHKPCIDKWLKSNSTCPICRLTAAFER